MNKKSNKPNGSNKKPVVANNGIVSKAEKKALRLKANQEWKNLDRMSWSDKDTNPRHTLYYKSQLPELSEEWQQFRSVMATDLPVTFRISERCGDIVASAIEKKLEKEFKKARGRFIEVKGQVITNDLVKRVHWYPNAYQISNCDSATFSKQPSLQPLYQYISREVSLGHIVRQELVSMIPAYVLNVKHDSIVLDMCAAPGSKTEQLVALMAQDAAKNNGNRPPEGLVVANDSDPKRIETLLKRFARNHSPNLMFTCSRAEEFTKHFGELSSSSNSSSSNGVSGTGISGSVSSSNFDRILCDVPCSGDGTFRKCPHLWRLFRPRGALDFHVIQLQIVSAGISILRTGGRLVYSTCSLNPIEDEAVVCALLQRFKGQIRLVDTRAEGLLPLLKSRPGISHWECNTDILTVGEPDEKTRLESVSRLPKILKTMVAPPAEVTAPMNLDRCMRIMPQDQDTGGFFVAVFERFADMPAPAVSGATKSTSNSSGSSISKSSANSYQIVNSNKNKASSAHDAHQSIAAMKRLGYNPKNLNNSSSNNNNSTGSSSAEGAQQQGSGLGFLTACRDLGGEETEMVAGVLDLDEERVYNMGVPPEERNEEGDCVLMLSEIAKEFSTIVAAATAAKNMTAEQAAELKEQEDRRQQAKKQKRFNGIFGSKSTGWAIQTEQESEDEEDALAVDVSKPSHRVVLMSKSAHEALHSWGRSIFIVQAGASIATGNWIPVSRTNEFAGFAHLNVDTAALGSVVANKSPDSVVEVNLSDFLFLLKHGMPKRFHREQQHQLALQRLEHSRATGNSDDEGEGEEEQEEYEEGGDYGSSAEGSEGSQGSDVEESDGDIGSEGGDNESHDGDQQQSRGHKRRREEDDDVDGEEEEEAGLEPFEDSVLIKRKYARMEENYISEDEVLPDQIMLSCDGCAQVYNFVDSASGGGEDEDDGEDDGGTVNPSFPVTLSAESWTAYFQSHAPQVSASGAVLAAEESEEPGMHSSAGQKKRLSKAEKKRLQKTGGASAVAVAKPAVSAVAAEPERKVVDVGALSTAPVTLLLRYEKVPFETKKSKNASGSARNYHLQLNVLSSEDACESLLATIQSHMKWA